MCRKDAASLWAQNWVPTCRPPARWCPPSGGREQSHQRRRPAGLAAQGQRAQMPPPKQGEWSWCWPAQGKAEGQTAIPCRQRKSMPRRTEEYSQQKKYLTFFPPKKILDIKFLFSFCYKISEKKLHFKGKGAVSLWPPDHLSLPITFIFSVPSPFH